MTDLLLFMLTVWLGMGALVAIETMRFEDVFLWPLLFVRKLLVRLMEILVGEEKK